MIDNLRCGSFARELLALNISAEVNQMKIERLRGFRYSDTALRRFQRF
jgi:hypothetical protein